MGVREGGRETAPSPMRTSLIFISKNFFNKKVTRSTPRHTRAYTDGHGYTARCILYRRQRGARKGEEEDGATKPPADLALKVSRRSRYFITFLYFEKRAVNRGSDPDKHRNLCAHKWEAVYRYPYIHLTALTERLLCAGIS